MSLKHARYLLHSTMRRSDLKHVLLEVLKERMRQEEKWGEQDHSPEKWITILMEEVGEFSKEVLENTHRASLPNDNLRAELVQIAAVALAMLECHDRNNWSNL